MLALLNPKRGERILDVGCGTGHLSKLIAEMGVEVVGIDSSPEMIEAARTAWPDINFVLADAADFSFTEPFDAVFSNAALHWVTEAERAVVCMARSLKQGGRVVVELGGNALDPGLRRGDDNIDVQRSFWQRCIDRIGICSHNISLPQIIIVRRRTSWQYYLFDSSVTPMRH